MLEFQQKFRSKLQSLQKLSILIITGILIDQRSRPQRHDHRCSAMAGPGNPVDRISNAAVISAAFVQHLTVQTLQYGLVIQGNQLFVHGSSSRFPHPYNPQGILSVITLFQFRQQQLMAFLDLLRQAGGLKLIDLHRRSLNHRKKTVEIFHIAAVDIRAPVI
ncbi:hypothetical protein D3C77_452620 [compost metagenome]